MADIEETEIFRLVKIVVDHFDKEDQPTRDMQIRTAKKLKYYWDGIHNIYWSEVAHDWRVFGLEQSQNNTYGEYYDKNVNVFRAYLESIIAALSVSVPAIKCAPDDADNALDISTAKAGDKIAELISKHNDVILLWLHALFVYCTEGMVACYNYTKEDDSYGTVSIPKHEQGELEQNIPTCPICKTDLPDPLLTRLEKDEFDPGTDDVEIQDLLMQDKMLCDACVELVDPEYRTEKIIVDRIVGTTEEPKARQCLEVYGLLYVKVPNYARKQEDCPYLIFSYETHYTNVLARYPDLWDRSDKKPKFSTSGSSARDIYGRWGRQSTQSTEENFRNNPTVRNVWLRPSSFYVLGEDVKKIQKKFPNGAKVVIINDTVAEVVNESLDDHWTLTHNPLSDYLHHDPLGLLLTSIQDITTELVSLTLQTIEHGIPQTFADPAVLNFNEYAQTEVSPGAIFPAKPQTGQSIGNAFYEVKTATLSGEVLPFMEKVQEAGQLVSGALPSLFGGAAPNSSKTAAQYAMSRAQALQRLQTPWKVLSYWWKEIYGKVIPAFIKDMKNDERFVSKSEAGNFVNVFIRKAEAEGGKIGSVELEASEQLPATWAQKKDVIMQLLQSGNPVVMQALISPENLNLLSDALGLADFVLPGQDDRQKQYEEIQMLIASEPLDEMTPSVEIEPAVDNHEIEADICRAWLISDAGRLSKIENPAGYRNVLLHLQQHVTYHQQMMMPSPEAVQGGGKLPINKNNKTQPMMEKQRGSTAVQ